ncbi:MAG: phytanoyl-CoA dioxygenase family protein [Steroidobacteraceae bacterium]|nr:phytanoyl-CoA dioxygenase family protein [Steroidobacteraceae bacterium]
MSRVSQAHIDTYRRIGAVRVEGVFDSRFVARLTGLIDEAIAALRSGALPRQWPTPHPVFRDIEFEDHDGYVRLVNLMPRVPAIERLILDSPAAETVAALTGATSLRFWLDAVFSKEGDAPQTATPWHNDECTFSLQGEHLPSCWIALTDVGLDNSPLQTLDGSHRDPHRYHSTFFPPDAERPPNYRPWQELLDRVNAPGAPITTWTVQAGDMLLIHPKTIHGAPPRARGVPGRRLAFTLRFIGSDVVWQPNSLTFGFSPFDRDPRMQRDRPPPEELFPIIWRAPPAPA